MIPNMSMLQTWWSNLAVNYNLDGDSLDNTIALTVVFETLAKYDVLGIEVEAVGKFPIVAEHGTEALETV